eukprot:GSMAST32.ASY1.ANO1.2647.1 assembled CDS
MPSPKKNRPFGNTASLPKAPLRASIKKEKKLKKETGINTSERGIISLQIGEDERNPGQKYPTPSPGQGTRVFYESLLRQNNESFMALKWCTEHGVYPTMSAEAAAAKVVDLIARRKASGKRIKSPVKKVKSIKSKKKRRRINDDVVDIGMSVGVWEGAGGRDM